MSDAAFPYVPRLIAIEMVGARPIFQGGVRTALVDALLSSPELVPEQVGMSEEGGKPFDRKALGTADWAPSQGTWFLRRTKGQPYVLQLSLSKRPHLYMEFPVAKTPARNLPLVFQAGDLLAAAFQPDMGWVHVSAELPTPPTAPDDVTQELMDLGSDGHPTKYGKYGPGGLGLRSYVGPFVVEQVGRQRLLELPKPAQATEQAWGGVRVDLAPDPWTASAKVLRDSWRKAMEHLRPAEFFATLSLGPEGELNRQRGTRCNPGGQVR
jgi:hypothetical protein